MELFEPKAQSLYEEECFREEYVRPWHFNRSAFETWLNEKSAYCPLPLNHRGWSTCSFVHTGEKLIKKKCRAFAIRGFCRREEMCKYDHVPLDQRFYLRNENWFRRLPADILKMIFSYLIPSEIRNYINCRWACRRWSKVIYELEKNFQLFHIVEQKVVSPSGKELIYSLTPRGPNVELPIGPEDNLWNQTLTLKYGNPISREFRHKQNLTIKVDYKSEKRYSNEEIRNAWQRNIFIWFQGCITDLNIRTTLKIKTETVIMSWSPELLLEAKYCSYLPDKNEFVFFDPDGEVQMRYIHSSYQLKTYSEKGRDAFTFSFVSMEIFFGFLQVYDASNRDIFKKVAWRILNSLDLVEYLDHWPFLRFLFYSFLHNYNYFVREDYFTSPSPYIL